MKISFWIPAVVYLMYGVRIVFNSIQVGTVLFTTTDLVKKCWSESDKSLLRARLIMQDVLPDPSCVDLSKPDAIVILLDYFQTCYDIITTSTYGKLQNLMYLALSDAFGGYLRSYVLPLTRRAYYSGQAKYSEAKKIFQLYEDIKVFLKTNGVGWAEPQIPCSTKFSVKPLVFSNSKGESPCKKLYLIEMRGKLRCIRTRSDLTTLDSKFSEDSRGSLQDDDFESLSEGSKVSRFPEEGKNSTGKKNKYDSKHKFDSNSGSNKSGSFSLLDDLGRSILKNDTCEGKTSVADYDRNCQFQCPSPADDLTRKRIIIPLPVLDDCSTPHTIAVPFVKRPLRNLQTRSSAFILERYYSTVIKCLISKKNTRADIQNFNAQFYTWLVSKVLPHLTDETWYPGFGGVLRVTETIKKFGVESTLRKPGAHDIGFMFSKGFGFENGKRRCSKGKGKERTRDVEDQVPYHGQRHFIIAVLIISCGWVFTFCACVFYYQAIKSRRVDLGRPPNRKGLTLCDVSADDVRRDEKFLNFKFLVRFFKKVGDGRECYGEKTRHENRGRELKCGPIKNEQKQKSNKEKNEEKRHQGPKREKPQPLKGEGDAPPFVVSNLQPNPVWPYDPTFIRFQEAGPSILVSPKGDALERSPKGPKNQVETIWKKPLTKFKKIVAPKESRGGEKSKKRNFGPTSAKKGLLMKTPSESVVKGGRKNKSSTCSYSETSQQTTTTYSSSQTQDSTEETESEDEGESYSSESGY